MADDFRVFPQQADAPVSPPVETNGALPHAEASAPARRTAPLHRSELRVFVCWFAGLLLVLVSGWGALAFASYLTRSNRTDPSLAFSLAGIFSLGLFFLYERNLWLSRFMGLRVGPNSATWKSALLLWLLGVPGLLFRSSAIFAESPGAAPAAAPAAAPQEALQPVPQQQADSIREIIETVVFVVVLVLMLRSFAAEAFVIPTGSMATTLWGYQKVVTCPECGYEFPVNCSQEVDPQTPPPTFVSGGICPNCLKKIHFLRPQEHPTEFRDADIAEIPDPGWNSGDRVLVAKFVYDMFKTLPQRLDVVVFKYPREPVKSHVPMNYIKRLVGRPGETIAIHYGKLYVLSPEQSKKYNDVQDAEGDPQKTADLWQREHMHRNDAEDQFKEGKFSILRKPPKAIQAMSRIVYDNDHPAKDLQGKLSSRWAGTPDGSWNEQGKAFQTNAAEQTAWLRYRHIVRGHGDKPRLITDFMGYNTWESRDAQHRPPAENWVGDLMLECEVTIDKPQGELVLELSKGVDRFRARWDLTNGDCTLFRLPDFKPLERNNEEKKLGTAQTALKKPGKYRLRFANVDDKLTLWVDNDLPFGDDGVPYEAAKDRGPTKENDLEPASIGARGVSLTVRHLTLWRDTYYTASFDSPGSSDHAGHEVDFGEPATWRSLHELPIITMYVQPGHFLCMGDNSPESSDGRSWGLVPERLLLGKALLVYYPFNRAGRIR
jgi:signal peptidase I